MTKLRYDNEAIISNIIPKIDRTIADLDRTITLNSQLKIPSNFFYRSFFNSYFNDIQKIKNDYSKERARLGYVNTTIENLIDRLETNLQDIKSIEIKSRGEII